MSTTTTTQEVPTQVGAPIVALSGPVVGGSTVRTAAGTSGLDLSEVDRAERIATTRSGELGSVYSWELVTSVDGPGTRLTAFLGRVDQVVLEPDECGGQGDGGVVAAGGLVGAHRDAAPALELVEAAFDDVAPAVGLRVEGRGPSAG